MGKHLIVTEDGDDSSNEVCGWFYRYGVPFKRLNLDSYKEVDRDSDLYSDYFNFDNVEISIPAEVKISDGNFEKEYRSIWYRRPNIKLDNMVISQNESGIPKFLLGKIRSNQKSELKELYEYVFNSSMTGSVTLGNGMKTRVNKLEILSLANELGICIPRTKVVSLKRQILAFQKEVNTALIAKSIFDPVFATNDDLRRRYTSYTNVLSDALLEKIPDRFSPSLIQEKVEKDFEIRTFVMGEHYYSMAIFSQNNQKTAVDFRRYDLGKPNRTIPFSLPEELTIKIKELLKRTGFNTCSIDFIKGENGKYYFLEINPVGQFGMVSKPCNYNIEHSIYQYLTQDEEGIS